MQNIPAKITYELIWNLAVQLAGRTPDNVPVAEEIMLQAFFAAELPDLWNKEAWPELCDNITAINLTNGVFSKNLGGANEIGDVLAVFTLDPRNTPGWMRFPPNRIVEANGQVYVETSLGTVFVDYQLPVPDLLDPSLTEETLMATALPARFRLPLAFRGAAHLLASEDPVMSAKYQALAEQELARQAAKLEKPYWRTEVRPDAPVCAGSGQGGGGGGGGGGNSGNVIGIG